MQINNNNDEVRALSFLYTKDAGILSHAQVFLRRLGYLITHFTWIDSQTIFQSAKNDDQIVRLFLKADISSELESRVAIVFSRVHQRNLLNKRVEAKIVLIKSLTQDLYLPIADTHPTVRLIQIARQPELTDQDKNEIDQYTEQSITEFIATLKRNLSLINKLRGLSYPNIPTLSSCDEKGYLSIIKELAQNIQSSIYVHLSDQEIQSLDLSDDEKVLLEALKQNDPMKRLDYWLENAKEPKKFFEVDNTLKAKLDAVLKLDERIEGYRKLVEKHIDLESMQYHEYDSRALVIALFRKRYITYENKLEIHSELRKLSEADLASFALNHSAVAVPQFDEEKVRQTIRFLKDHPLPRHSLKNNGLYSISIVKISTLADGNSLSKRERYLISQLDTNKYLSDLERFKLFTSTLETYQKMGFEISDAYRNLTHGRIYIHQAFENHKTDAFLDSVVISSGSWFRKLFLPLFKSYMIALNFKPHPHLSPDQNVILNTQLDNELNEEQACLFLFKKWEKELKDPIQMKEIAFSAILSFRYNLNCPITNNSTNIVGFRNFIEDYVDIRRFQEIYSNGKNLQLGDTAYTHAIGHFLYGNSMVQAVTSGPYPAITRPFRAKIEDFILSSNSEIPEVVTYHPYFIGRLYAFVQKHCSKQEF